MHPLNPYVHQAPDFAALAARDTTLAKYVQTAGRAGIGIGVGGREGNGDADGDAAATIDFADPDAVRALTQAILRHDFGVYATLRTDRLCPPIPNRLNYIAWIQELLEATCIANAAWSKAARDADEELAVQRPAKKSRSEARPCGVNGSHFSGVRRILDIGTGSTSIYPLLGCALHGDWHFVATDIDDSSLAHAQQILNDPRNNEASCSGRSVPFNDGGLCLHDRVHLLHRRASQPLLLDTRTIDDLCLRGREEESLVTGLFYHVSMCNPPFYESQAEMKASLAAKKSPPSGMNQGIESEMIYEGGGEIAFVGRMIKESAAIRARVLWFTSMLGKQASVGPLVTQLRALSVDNYLVSEFVQGAKTRRWALAWSFMPFRIPRPLVSTPSALRQKKPDDAAYEFDCGSLEYHVDHADNAHCRAALASIQEHLRQRGIHSYRESLLDTPSTHLHAIVASASRDTWTRKARRRAAAQTADTVATRSPALVVRLLLSTRAFSPPPSSPSPPSSPYPSVPAERRRASARMYVDAQWLYGHDHTLFQSLALSVVRHWAATYASPA